MAHHSMQFDRRPINSGIPAILNAIWDTRNRSLVIATILALALFAFEIFNFDTTKFALHDLLGETSFMSMTWAAILAFAFCAIDFAGLVKIFTPQQGRNEPREVWYLMGAWLLGATMNSIMTWYAVSVLLMQRPIGTEVLSREQLLTYVPIFVAVLVWLTRILFIGSLSMAGEQLMNGNRLAPQQQESVHLTPRASQAAGAKTEIHRPAPPVAESVPVHQPAPASRIRRRPPAAAVPMSAKPRR